jgi:hypothetical protein
MAAVTVTAAMTAITETPALLNLTIPVALLVG